MKTTIKQKRGFLIGGLGVAAALMWLAISSSNAATNSAFTAMGYVVGVPVYGISVTNNSGQVSMRGNVHVLRMQSDNPLANGRVWAFMDVAYNADGSGKFTGTGYIEVGAWDLSNTNNPLFTPTGTVIAMNYGGDTKPDNSNQMELSGHVISGPNEGSRLVCSFQRAAGPVFDPTIPYIGGGSILTPPNSSIALRDDFNDNVVSNKWQVWSSGTGRLTETNGQLTVRGSWASLTAPTYEDTTFAFWMENWKIDDGQTMEWRATLSGINQDAEAAVLLAGTAYQRFNTLLLKRDSIVMGKWGSGGMKTLIDEPVTIRQTNVILSLAITRQNTTGVITVRVLDKDNPDTVLYSKMILDADPYFYGDSMELGVWPKANLQHPVADATFDNYTWSIYDVPPINICRAMSISCAIPEHSMFSLETAPSVNGPWLPFKPSSSGLLNITVPGGDGTQFFRLR